MRIAIALVLSVSLAALTLASSSSDSQGNKPTLNGYLVKAESDASVARLTNVVHQVLGPEWDVTNGRLPGYFQVRHRSGLPTRATHAAAWDIVHTIGTSSAIAWAEPAFTGAMQLFQEPEEPVGECTPRWTKFGSAPDDPIAMKDSEWSLRPHPGVNAEEAWKLFSSTDKAGAGIIVGHPDTGYLDHAAIKRARLGDGFDFTSRKNSAIDLAEAGNVQWPGHGTRTSSVIAGRPFVVEGGVRRISGVAPAAQFMPLKVAHRVVFLPFVEFDMENLAIAIHAAAIGDPNFVDRPAQVISMSIGGRNSRAVQEALRVAEEHQVIVLAAAGNKVPGHVVVYPARYANVLAIAASNSTEGPWPHTSRGRSIAVSAPGQNVWSAKRRESEGVSYDCAEMSSGTSYAVATTAGVAALWLSYHQQRGALSLIKDRPRAFRQLVRATAWVPRTWDNQKLGAGIVNAKELLEADPSSVTAGVAKGVCDDMVAIASILTLEDATALLTGTRNVDHACRSIGQTGDELASVYSEHQGATLALERFLDSAGTGNDLTVLREAILAITPSKSLQLRLRTAAKVEALALRPPT